MRKKKQAKRASEDPRVRDLAARVAFVGDIRDFVNELGGNVSRAATRLGLRRQMVWGWLEDSILPDLRTIKVVRKRLAAFYQPMPKGGAS